MEEKELMMHLVKEMNKIVGCISAALPTHQDMIGADVHCNCLADTKIETIFFLIRQYSLTNEMLYRVCKEKQPGS